MQTRQEIVADYSRRSEEINAKLRCDLDADNQEFLRKMTATQQEFLSKFIQKTQGKFSGEGIYKSLESMLAKNKTALAGTAENLKKFDEKIMRMMMITDDTIAQMANLVGVTDEGLARSASTMLQAKTELAAEELTKKRRFMESDLSQIARSDETALALIP